MDDDEHKGMAAGADVAFRIIDHTADVGVVANGRNLAELFVNAARGLFSVMIDPQSVVERERREITVNAADREALLVDWLNELLFLFDAEQLVFKHFVVLEVADTTLRAQAWGEKIDPSRHHFKTAVKAVTYHMLSVVPGTPWRARVILDV